MESPARHGAASRIWCGLPRLVRPAASGCVQTKEASFDFTDIPEQNPRLNKVSQPHSMAA